MTTGRGAAHLRWLVPTALAVVGAVLPFLLISPDLPCDSDEAHHVMLGLKYQRDLSHGDFTGFVRHTLKTGRYPFLHGWYVAAALTVLGPSYIAVRATSAILLGAAAALAALLLYRVRPEVHPLWGLLAGGMVTLAPETMGSAVLCMLEVPGLFLMLLGAWAYHRFLERPDSVRRGAHVGLSVVALFLVKYPYGAYLYLPLLIAELWRARFRLREGFRWGSLSVWGPMAVVGVLWLAIPYTRQSVVTLLADAPHETIIEGGRDPSAIPYIQPDLVLFYARTLMYRLSPGPQLDALALAGFLVYLLRGRGFDRLLVGGAVLWTVFTLTLSFRTFGVNRFLVPVGGLFAVGAVAGLAPLVQGVWRNGVLSKVGGVTVAAALLIGSGDSLLRQGDLAVRTRTTVETTREEREALRWLQHEVQPPANLLLVGAWDQFNEESVEIEYLYENPGAHHTELDVKAVRVGKIYRGVGRLDRWFEDERTWAPDGERGRRTYVLRIAGGELRSARTASPDSWPDIEARADEWTRRLGGKVVAEYPGPAGTRFSLWLLETE